MTASDSPPKKGKLFKAIFAGTLGNALEWYDYGIYGYFALIIARNFFTSDNPLTALLLSFLVFASGFVVRPLGGVIIGVLSDKHGRTKTLAITIIAMGICTLCMGLIPPYSKIGVAAPILLTLLRMLQGLAAGGGTGTSITFMAEYATEKNRAFLVSWQPWSTGAGLLLGSIAGLITSTVLPEEALFSWGWRIPFLLGILISINGIFMLRSVGETPAFEKEVSKKAQAAAERKADMPRGTPFRDVLRSHKIALITIMGLLAGSSVTYYILITFMPTYITQFLQSSLSNAFLVNTSVILIFLILTPFIAKLVDRIGTRISLIIGCLGFIVLSYPVFYAVTISTSPITMIAVLGALMVFQPLISVAICVVSAEILPTKVRNSGIGLAYNLSVAIFGGCAPLMATAIIGAAGTQISIIYLIIPCIAITLLTTWFLLKPARKP